MSFDRFAWINAVWDSDELKAADKTVAAYLWSRADQDGVCWPSMRTIAARTKLDRGTVKAARERLEESKWLKAAKRKTKVGWSYTLTLLPKGVGEMAAYPGWNGDLGGDFTRVKSLPRVGEMAASGGVKSLPLIDQRTDQEQSNAATRARDPSELDADEKILVAFVGVGMHSAHVGQCQHLLAEATKFGVPEATEWLTERIGERGPYCKGGAAMLTKWLLDDIRDGKWREWSVKRSARLVGQREGYTERPAAEYVQDHRTPDEILTAAGDELVTRWVEHLRSGWDSTQLQLRAVAEGWASADEYLRNEAAEMLRYNDTEAP